MRYRAFGRTGWEVSEISFGAWQLGGDWGEVDDAASVRTLLHAFERGVNFVDTAELYGRGHSEEVVGRAVREWTAAHGARSSGGGAPGDGRVHVATKIQPTVWPEPADDAPQMPGRYPAWHLRRGVDDALRRLGVERIDLLQLHGWFADGVRHLDWLETLNELRLAGKVDRIGVSIRDYRPDEGVELARLGLVDSIQVVFNLFEQRPAADLFAAGAGSGTAFIARVPLDSGSLVGHWTAQTYSTWQPGSVPHQLFRGDRFPETLERVGSLKAVCAPWFPTLAEAAMRYVLSEKAVATVIPGMTTPAEVDLNIAYSDGAPFPEQLREQLPEHGWPRNFYA
jgi:aryl-alcohol dehydrogenase-like predicted oxidoreductase